MKPSESEVKTKDRTPIFAILDNVRSLFNVGAIFRTSDAVLLEKIYLCGITGFPPRKEISKTALGAENLVPWEYKEETFFFCFFEKKKKRSYYKVCLSLFCFVFSFRLQKY